MMLEEEGKENKFYIVKIIKFNPELFKQIYYNKY